VSIQCLLAATGMRSAAEVMRELAPDHSVLVGADTVAATEPRDPETRVVWRLDPQPHQAAIERLQRSALTEQNFATLGSETPRDELLHLDGLDRVAHVKWKHQGRTCRTGEITSLNTLNSHSTGLDDIRV